MGEDLLWLKGPEQRGFQVGMNYQFQGTPLTTSERTLDVSEMAYILSSYTMFGILFGASFFSMDTRTMSCQFCDQLGSNRTTCYENYSSYYEYYSNEDDKAKTELTLTPQLFGEQRWSGGAITYEAALDWFPLFKKLQPRADISASIFLGPAMELFLEASARALISTDKDNDVLLPEKGYEFRFFSGLSFRPSQIF